MRVDPSELSGQPLQAFELSPHPQVVNVHAVDVAASPDDVFTTVRDHYFDAGCHPAIEWLFLLRGWAGQALRLDRGVEVPRVRPKEIYEGLRWSVFTVVRLAAPEVVIIAQNDL